MTTSLFTQKNICAGLGLLLALTIVFMANQEIRTTERTAQFEDARPATGIGAVTLASTPGSISTVKK
jgi:hypothetical protein